MEFLLYSPLNQGLKHGNIIIFTNAKIMFLLYSPLNQGLKLLTAKSLNSIRHLFLLYSPLNQGLKPTEVTEKSGGPQSFYSTVH